MPLLPTLLCLALVGSEPCPQAGSPARVERHLGSMGTGLHLVLEGTDRAVALAASESAARAIEASERRLSTWSADSELARFNRSAPGTSFQLSAELAAELEAARTIWRRTDGAFDPSVGALVRAWALREGGRMPSEDELELALAAVGFDALQLDGRAATRGRSELSLEEGGFGKGAGLDAAVRALVELPVHGWLDLGGQVIVVGKPPKALEFDVAHPRAREQQVVRLSISSGSLATSGNSERGIVVDGQRLGHLLDPRTGRPAADFGSITVHSTSGLQADALATGLFVLGPEAALAYGREHPGVSVLVLEVLADGDLALRCSGDWTQAPLALDPRVRVGDSPSTEVAPRPRTDFASQDTPR